MKLLYLIILIPIISFIILLCFTYFLSKKHIAIISIGSISLSLIMTIINSYSFIKNHYITYNQHLWKIINIDYLNVNLNLNIDMLTISMLFITLGVGLLIHIYSIWYIYQYKKNEYARFFIYTNLFMISMLLLVLADNLLIMFFGWEGVGICSYLLIGFFYRNKYNGYSAIKAFLITRFSDIFLVISMMYIFYIFRTFNFHKIVILITSSYMYYNTYHLKFIAITLLIGALGKSVQYPLNTWLINAMAGPTPASALIHAATMVTAGIYLILRNNIIFIFSDSILTYISVIGIITLLLSGCCALVQTNIKYILAYSTMSQLGYMFLALGICSWNAAIFHIIAHAFFKALLFLCAASIIMFCCNEQNIFYMQGLKKHLYFLYYVFLFGSISLISIPIITLSGFTKEKILYEAYVHNHLYLTILGLCGSFITSLYTTRMFYIIFYSTKNHIKHYSKLEYSFTYYFPLTILTILTTGISKIFLPLHTNIISPQQNFIKNNHLYHILEFISLIIILSGFIVYILYSRYQQKIYQYSKNNIIKKIYFIKNFFLHGCYIDMFYQKIIGDNFLKILLYIKNDPITKYIDIIINILYKISDMLLKNQNGNICYYISFMYAGNIIILLFIIINKILLK
ncbi:NADH-quinone oxidoreductase subunit L [Enterobacteriaceae endosymbiont of Macroplea appendiculata]|uniref:NADH-quinone oxidoreductase subunit L n=1 Tax=Enterobacteriaceae endosymbiont of Macroplea appendiculata TaxID=2675790 RepID=UPI0014496D53|nr:NADH-quinone oxidoreductase subunit L [Enterobacteriaceae endosymbiont of Macroplea appendiculata]QJC30961.1 NADH-quinone oxidoreductase subunit L [Enterobacteriaceae endosymbiont of Macroplea appendiculata]